jgi:hypothetical protein
MEVKEDLPTPPLPLITTITFLILLSCCAWVFCGTPQEEQEEQPLESQLPVFAEEHPLQLDIINYLQKYMNYSLSLF